MSPEVKYYPNEASLKLDPFAIREMLVALELGPSDEAVLNYLDFLSAKVPVSAANFAHVLPKFDLYYMQRAEEASAVISNYELNTEVVERMQKRLDARPIKKQVETLGFEIQKGNPLEELLNSFEKNLVELLVIGQRAGNGEHGILARNLVRKIKGNALIVPQEAKSELNTIMVPFDFSEDALKALKAALALQERLGDDVKVDVVHVYQMPNLSIYKVQKTFDQLKTLMEEDRQKAFKDFMKEHVPGYENKVNFRLIEQAGPGIARFLMKFAENHGANLIIMGAKGHSRVERLLLGSVTEKMCSMNETIPTMIIRR